MKAAMVIFVCLLGLVVSACAPPTYRPNPRDPFDFKGDLNNLGADEGRA